MDCLNSSALLIAPKIFNDLDINLIKINCNKDNYASNAPDPTVDENLKEPVSVIMPVYIASAIDEFILSLSPNFSIK